LDALLNFESFAAARLKEKIKRVRFYWQKRTLLIS
jgi:hypothetical protein